MLSNEVFALQCLARYAKEGLVVDSSNGQFAHCPYPKGMGDDGHYLTFFDHQHQGLLQSVDVGRRCYWIPDVKLYLDTEPLGQGELRVIYDRFNKMTKEHKRKIGEANSGEKSPMFCIFGALHPDSKAIIVIEPDGAELHFGSCIEAARKLEIDKSNLRYFLRNGHVVTKGKCEGYQFFYAE